MRRPLLLTACLLVAMPVVACNDDGGDFCGDFSDALDELRSVDADVEPDELRRHYTAMAERLEALSDSAPEEVADDVEAVRSGYESATEELEAVDFDRTKLPDRGPEAFGTARYGEAARSLQSYAQQECDIDATPSTTSPASDGATSTTSGGAGTTSPAEDGGAGDDGAASTTVPEDEEAPSTSQPPA